MTEEKKSSTGWAEEDRVYTVIQNIAKNSKLVLSTLNGIEIAPGQTVDLRTMFRKSQVVDAAHEIASLISTGHLKDMGAGASAAPIVANGGGAPTAAEMQERMRKSKLLAISDSTSMSALADWMNDKDQQVAQAAKVRAGILMGTHDENGQVIPGNEETEAKPTEMIRSPIGGGDPVVAGVQESSAPALTAAGVAAGVVRRSE